jgi:hypothetical protein
MSIETVVIPDLNLFFLTYRGPVNGDQMVTAFLGVIEHPLFHREMHLLTDQSAHEVRDMNFRDIQRLTFDLAPYYEARSAQARTALYCPTDGPFGLCRMYATAQEDKAARGLGLFRTRTEAVQFLGLDAHDPVIMAQIWPDAAG